MEELRSVLSRLCRLFHESEDIACSADKLRADHLDQHGEIDSGDNAIRFIVCCETAGGVVGTSAKEIVEENDSVRTVKLLDCCLIFLHDIIGSLARHERHRAHIRLRPADHLAGRHDFLGKLPMRSNNDSKHLAYPSQSTISIFFRK